MAVTNTELLTGPYYPNGSTFSFAFDFRVLTKEELVVWRGQPGSWVAVDPALYNVNINLQEGGAVVFDIAPPAGGPLYIEGNPDFQQDSAFGGGEAPFTPKAINTELERAALRSAKLLDGVQRSITVPRGELAIDLPGASARRGTALVFDPVSGSATVRPLGSFPAGPPGGSDNTYKGINGLTAFKASDIGEATASLVDVPNIPDGRFNWTPGDTTPDDGQNYIASTFAGAVGRWKRQRSDPIGPSPIALESGITNADASGDGAVQIAQGQFNNGNIPNRRLGVRGKGMLASRLQPATTTGVTLRVSALAPSWDAVFVADAGMFGLGTQQSIGIRMGPDVYAPGAEYAGRLVVERKRFENYDICIDRPYGNIGQTIRDSVFETANIHLKAISNPGTANGGVGDVMHAGCSWVTDSHFQGALVASDYIDGRNVVGTCQIVRRGTIFESNPGHVHYFTNVRHQGGFPAIKIADEYHENNHTLATVTTPDGVTVAPAWLHANNTNLTILDNSAPGRVRLLGSALLTIGSDLTMAAGLASVDPTSSWINRDARAFTSKAPGLTVSIAEVQNATALNAATYEMPVPTSIAVENGDVLCVSSAQVPETWVGSASVTTTTVASGIGLPFMQNSQRITIGAGQTVFPQPSFSVAPNKYVVVKYVAQLVSGPGVSMSIDGASGLGGGFFINNSAMRTHVGIFRTGASNTGAVNLYHRGGGAASVLDIAGYCVRQFDTAQEALAFANSGLMHVEARPAWAVTNPTPQRTLNAAIGIPAAASAYSQADQQVIVDQLNATRATLATLLSDLKLGRHPQ